MTGWGLFKEFVVVKFFYVLKELIECKGKIL
jgi:hypothetical protein